ncbi:MAG: DUF1080 domain-containing protein [Gemmatimonas sp.]
MPARRTALRFTALLVVLSGCSRMAPSPGSASPSPAAAQTAAANGAWRSLVSLDNWRGYQAQTVPAAWTVQDGILTKTGVGQDIVSRETFTDFELEFDWMLNAGGNSGLFYRATEEYEKIYWSAPEYALLDDARHPDGRNVLTSAGAAHSLYAPPRGVVKAAGQWNSTRVVVRGTHVEHWLNAQKVAEFEYGSPDFTERVARSKFGRWPNFAKAPRGLIGIQGDHGGVLSIRDMRIRELR